jgi:hypothetical protein
VALAACAALVLLASACANPGGDTDDEAGGDVSEAEVAGDEGGEAGDDDDVLTGGELILRDFELPLPLFSSSSAWNQRVDDVEVLPESEDQILALYRQLVGDSSNLVPGDEELLWPFVVVNYDAFTYPIFRAGEGTQEVLVSDYDGVLWYPSPTFPEAGEEGGPVTVPALEATVRPAGPAGSDSDGHLVLFEPETDRAYDFWQATTALDDSGESLGGGRLGDAIVEAGAVEMFDLAGAGANPEGLSSARAMGPPLLGGLVVPEDVERGVIAHALGFAAPGPRNLSDDPSEPLDSDWFYPASTTETDFFSTDPDAIAAGQRIRLKPEIVDDEGSVIDESGLAPITRMFLQALREYGAYLIDASGGFSFSAEDIHTANLAVSDEGVNELIGAPAGTPLPADRTRWQVVMESLAEDLEFLPLAAGPWEDFGPDGRDPTTATFSVSNFEVVEPALGP